ncbi:MAG: hypothetical protein Q4F29_03540 [Lachnospiraceae bacterium]|nr:hypothetical protein [Lachnospiraceae bacterium]
MSKKRLLTGIISLAVLCAAGSFSAFATQRQQPKHSQAACECFTDADGDGICDNQHEKSEHCTGRQNFTDSDQDGVCDNRKDAGRRGGHCGKGRRNCR